MERLDDLKMHETMRASTNVDVMRVPGGLIYWRMMDRISGDASCAVSGVFVEFINFKIKDREYL